MSEKKSFTGWMERPVWERAALVVLILFCVVGVLALLGNRG